MANLKDVRAVVADLHDKKILNADTSIKSLLAVQADTLTSGADKVADWYVVGGQHYVVVCGKVTDIATNPVANPITHK